MTKLQNSQLFLQGNALVVPLKGPAKNYYFDENFDSKKLTCWKPYPAEPVVKKARQELWIYSYDN